MPPTPPLHSLEDPSRIQDESAFSLSSFLFPYHLKVNTDRTVNVLKLNVFSVPISPSSLNPCVIQVWSLLAKSNTSTWPCLSTIICSMHNICQIRTVGIVIKLITYTLWYPCDWAFQSVFAIRYYLICVISPVALFPPIMVIVDRYQWLWHKV